MIFQYSDDEAKRYHSWNYALRQQFGGKFSRSLLMAALTVQTETERSHTAAVPFAVFQVPAI